MQKGVTKALFSSGFNIYILNLMMLKKKKKKKNVLNIPREEEFMTCFCEEALCFVATTLEYDMSVPATTSLNDAVHTGGEGTEQS